MKINWTIRLPKWGKKDNPFPLSKQVIEHAFDCGGKRYYRHVDEMNMPYRRALKALSIYKELEMKCDRYYLDQHIAAMDKLLNGKKFGINELMHIKQLNDQLQERVQWVVMEDHLYKLAAVRYFDESESPEDFDWRYALQKIEHWKKHEAGSFFLREPLKSWLPFISDVSMDFQLYSQTVQALDQAHLGTIYGILYPEQRPTSPDSSARLFWEETTPPKSV
jgi:hypothetical protein